MTGAGFAAGLAGADLADAGFAAGCARAGFAGAGLTAGLAGAGLAGAGLAGATEACLADAGAGAGALFLAPVCAAAVVAVEAALCFAGPLGKTRWRPFNCGFAGVAFICAPKPKIASVALVDEWPTEDADATWPATAELAMALAGAVAANAVAAPIPAAATAVAAASGRRLRARWPALEGRVDGTLLAV